MDAHTPLTIPAALRRFARAECGAVAVDWAVLTAAATAMALGAGVLLVAGSDAFQTHVRSDLSRDVSGVKPTSARTDAARGQEPDGTSAEDDGELRFKAVSIRKATASTRVSCGDSINCGESSETVTRRYLMSDGSVWTRTSVYHASDSDPEDQWFDGDGRETRDVPDMPEDVPEAWID
ncbi:hypothetical protein [Jannaschia sp. W003]|uniref:hypothetical protein n=1 Tax=Jannaschia sp. W003 TaxID=2867012 RepID=UPI0021A5458B|nr:hypothetical protein [Jannaschia sp. W003]UWQ22806.1 hypothetical protein K3554_07225 [Jannaschia sp. W003]